MNKKICRVKNIVITILLASCFACSDKNNTDALLKEAEALLISHPDSALSIIGSIPMTELGSQRQKAEFILLYERILDKNDISLIGEDDMVSTANYFDKNGKPYQKFLSHFYMGRIYDLRGDKYRAMEQYVESEGAYKDIPDAERESAVNDFKELRARIYLYKGDIYQEKLNFNGALQMYLKAAGYYEEYGSDKQLMELLGKVAKGYETLDKFDQARKAYAGAMHFAGKANSRKDMLHYSTSIAGINFSTGTPSGVVLRQLDSIYAVYNNGLAPNDNYILLSCLHLDNGNLRKAKEFAQKYVDSTEELSSVEEAGLATLLSSIAKAGGNYKEALEYNEQYASIMASIGEQEHTNSLQEIEQVYFNKQLLLENENIKKQNRYTLIIYSLLVAIMLLFVLWGIVAWRKKLREKNNQLEEYLAVAHEAETSKNNLLGELDIHKEKEKRLKELLENRFAEIRELAGTYYEFGYSKKLQKKVEQLISLQSFGKDMFEVIENVVNAKNNGAIEKIRKEYPSITEDNIKLLNLIYAGFSPQEISVIINDTPQNIYVRKSRLKRKIAPLIAQDPEIDFR